MATRISVRYGNSIMEEGEPFVSGKNLRTKKKNLISYPLKLLLFRQL
jgi:hypothetical protein